MVEERLSKHRYYKEGLFIILDNYQAGFNNRLGIINIITKLC